MILSLFKKEKKWENCGGCVNIHSDLTESDIPKLINEPGIDSVQFYSFKTPSDKTWAVLNDFLKKYPHINLTINWHDSTNIDFLNKVQNVKDLSIKCFNTKDFSLLSKMKNIESLHIGETKSISVDIGFIAEMKSINVLSIDGMKKGIEKIQYLENIWSLNLRGIKLNNLDWIQSLKKLELLKLMFGSYKSIDMIKECPNLKYLGISRVRQIENYDFINSLNELEFLHFEGMSEIESLPDFSGLNNLKKLKVDNLSRLQDIKSISQLTNLEELLIFFPENFSSNRTNEILNQAYNICLNLHKLRLTNLLHWDKYIETKDFEKKGIEMYKHEKSKWKQNIEGGWTL